MTRIVRERLEPSETTEPVEAAARIEKRRQFELVIALRSEGGEETRTASSPSCRSLGDAAAIILAAAVVRTRHVQAPVVAEQPTPTVTEPESPPAPLERMPPPTEPARIASAPSPSSSLPKLGLGVGGLVDGRTLPHPAAGVFVTGTLEFDRLQFGIAGSLWARGKQTFENGGGVRFDVWDVGAFGCWKAFAARVRLGPCLEFDLTQMKVEGVDIRNPSSARLLWPTVRGGLFAELAVSQAFVVFARLDAAFAIAAPPVVLTTSAGDLDVHDVGVPALRAMAGVHTNVL